MNRKISRRNFLGSAALGGAFGLASRRLNAVLSDATPAGEFDFEIVDYHAHALEGNAPMDKILAAAKERGVKLGVLEHGGHGEVLNNDATLKAYIEKLAGLPVYKGIQAEGVDWPKCFSKEVVAQLDYVLSDALTLPERGKKTHIWTSEVHIEDPQDFMERYVAFNVQVITEEPIDIFANPTFLPDAILAQYDALWTRERMMKIIEAAKKENVAIEINSRYNIPSLAFLRLAKEAGVKFSFGTNKEGLEVGKLDYSLKMAKALGLTRKDMFVPAPAGKKPIQRRTFTS